MSRYLRPADLARATGLSTQSVRTYETLGFLPPEAQPVIGSMISATSVPSKRLA